MSLLVQVPEALQLDSCERDTPGEGEKQSVINVALASICSFRRRRHSSGSTRSTSKGSSDEFSDVDKPVARGLAMPRLRRHMASRQDADPTGYEQRQ